MAKGKQAAALFEVIHSSRQYDRVGARGLLRTPKWWFKRRNGNGSTPAPGAAQLALPAPLEPAGPAAVISSSSSSASAGPGGIRIHVDPDGQHVTLRLSYTATAVVLFTIGVLIVLAYLVGRQTRPDS